MRIFSGVCLSLLGLGLLAACGGRSSLNDYSDGKGILQNGDPSSTGDGDGNGGLDGGTPGDGDGDGDKGHHGGDGDHQGGDGDHGHGDGDVGPGDGDTGGDGDVGPGDGDTGGDGDTAGDGDTGGDGDSTAPGPGEIGGACQGANDCNDDGATCFTDLSQSGFPLKFPGGYCAIPNCTSDRDCPDGSGCLMLMGMGMSGSSCVDLCDTKSDCRVGYNCQSLSFLGGGDAKYCIPPLPGIGGAGG